MKNTTTKQEGRPEQVVKLLNFFYTKTDRYVVRYPYPDEGKRIPKSV